MMKRARHGSTAAPVQKRTGVTTLHVTHSLSEAKKLADRLLVLKNGQIEEVSLTGEKERL